MGEGLVEQLRQDVEMEVRWLPFELHPDTPVAGRPLAEYFGVTQQQLERMHAQLRARAEAAGLEMNPPAVLANTRAALLLAEYAREQGKLDALHTALFRAYFVDGQNLGDTAVLRALAAGAGLDPDESLAASREPQYAERLSRAMAQARQYGVDAVPTFILNGRHKIVGAYPLDVLRDAFRRVAQESADQ